jgi:Na+-translocating ferredoxin:NAD+ oxidoreductase subunit A
VNLLLILVSSVLINNFVLHYFLGICPYLGVSKKIDAAFSMGVAVTFVLALTAVVSWPVNHWVLKPYKIEYLQIVAFILIIASLVQLVEMFIRKTSPPLYQALGIYLPLITVNCCIMGFALLASLKDYNFAETVVFGVGAGIGFTLAIVLMAAIRQQLELADIPEALKGPGITLIVAGILALAFIGFSGMIK